MTDFTTSQHLKYLREALHYAKQAPASSERYCVGAVIVTSEGDIISTGYTGELPGNTHAEQCAFEKLLPQLPPGGSVLYTTMEPCSMRLSGNKTCVDRICDFQGLIGTVVVGVKEPGDFVANNEGEEKLRDAGVDYLYVPGLEEEILEIAKRGHGRRPSAVQ